MLVKFIFTKFHRKILFSEFSKHFLNILNIFLVYRGEYKYIIEVGYIEFI